MDAGVTSICPSDPATRIGVATAADEPFVRALFRATRAEQFAAANLPAEIIDRLLEQQYRAQAAGYAAQFPDAASLIVMHDDVPVGRLVVQARRETWRIIDIALLRDAQGEGIGTDLVQAVAAAARGAGARELSLSVRTGNVAARRLYARLGFAEIRDDGAYVAMTRPLTDDAVSPPRRSP